MIGYLIYGILIFVNIAIYVMVQMYFEGHEAFNELSASATIKNYNLPIGVELLALMFQTCLRSTPFF